LLVFNDTILHAWFVVYLVDWAPIEVMPNRFKSLYIFVLGN